MEVENILKIQRSKEHHQTTALLSSLTDGDLKCGEIFSKWSQNEIKSLEDMEKSVNFIKWLKDHMSNFQEFKFFVDLASISAGENDIEVDRVMFMQAAVSAYSALIFDIGPNSGLADLLRAVQHLFDAVKEDSHIPEKLVDTNRHLAWIKVIKERHGSVETSSLQQVEAINKSGVYVIGNFHQKGKKSLIMRYKQVDHDQSQGGHHKDYQKVLTVEELKELQSKLMLISKSDAALQEVERFVACLSLSLRIERGIKKLFDAGCNLTRRMSVIVYCNLERKRKVRIDVDMHAYINHKLSFI